MSPQRQLDDAKPPSQLLQIGARRPLTKFLFRELTATEFPLGFAFSMEPKFEDIIDNDTFRLDLNAKYGITLNWEVGIRFRFVLDNPFGKDDRTGLGSIQLTTKYRWKELLWERIEVASGIKWDIPVSDDPELSDGINHIEPWTTFLRVQPNLKGLITYVHTAVDVFLGDITLADLRENNDEIDSTFWRLAPGLIYVSPPWYFMVDVEWNTNFDDQVLLVTPGVRWEMPKLRWLPGLWTFEVGPRIGMLDAADEYSVSIRVLVDFAKRIDQKKQGAFQYLPFHRQKTASSWWSRPRL